jgi:hypothetical protein
MVIDLVAQWLLRFDDELEVLLGMLQRGQQDFGACTVVGCDAASCRQRG